MGAAGAAEVEDAEDDEGAGDKDEARCGFCSCVERAVYAPRIAAVPPISSSGIFRRNVNAWIKSSSTSTPHSPADCRKMCFLLASKTAQHMSVRASLRSAAEKRTSQIGRISVMSAARRLVIHRNE
jgi:hypothetical protein